MRIKKYVSLFLFIVVFSLFSCVSSNTSDSDQFDKVIDAFPESDQNSSFAVSFVDFDNDGFPDIYITNWEYGDTRPLNTLYKNKGDGSFEILEHVLPAMIGASLGHSWGDWDNDGDLDLSVANPGIRSEGCSNSVYTNNDGMKFEKLAAGPMDEEKLVSMVTAWIDFDNDGYLDLFSVNHGLPSDTHETESSLFRNNNGQLVKLDNEAIGLVRDEANSISCGDFNGDGFIDLFVTRNQGLNILYKNLGNGNFQWMRESIISQEKTGSGNWIDYDNDGDLDLFAIGFGINNTLYENVGDDEFTKVEGLAITADIGYYSSSNWADYDNDGDLDLFLAANKYYKPEFNRLYINNGNGTFHKLEESIIVEDLEASTAGAWSDYDRDGDLDLLIVNTKWGTNSLYRNNGNRNSWISIQLVGTSSNRSALGAKVHVKTRIHGEIQWQMRELSSQNGLFAQNDMNIHFGLGKARKIEELRIEWPSGIVETFEDVDVKQFIVIEEKGSLEEQLH